MKERPILFSGEMVRAILEGRKTQTRRVMKPQPNGELCDESAFYEWANALAGNCRVWPRQDAVNEKTKKLRDGKRIFPFRDSNGRLFSPRNPYGVPGDQLWVREVWCRVNATGHTARPLDSPQTNLYRATCTGAGIYPWKSPIHMPKNASRITLEITDIRVQRVREISEKDAIAEGIDRCESSAAPWAPFLYCDYNLANPDDCAEWFASPIDSFRSLWDSINAKRGFGWDKNPWVWALTFRRVQ